MEDFNEYMEEFKKNSLDEKKSIALEQLKVIVSLVNKLCEEIGCNNKMIVTKDVIEANRQGCSEDDFVEGVVVYASSIQDSLCEFIDKMDEVLKNDRD